MSQNVTKCVDKDIQPQRPGVESTHETKSSLHVASYVSRGAVGVVAQPKDRQEAGSESKERAESVDPGCTAGLRTDREPGAQMRVPIKPQGNVVNQTASLSSTAIISLAK